MKILIIDDDEDITGLLARYLTGKGFENVVTSDPMEGLGHVKKEKYDVIILDIKMPVISGLNIIQILAAGGKLKNKNIFIFSGADYNQNQIKDLLKRDGINGCLKKPIELDELLKTITR